MTRATSQQLAGLSLLDDSGPEMEGEHGGGVSLLLVQLVRLRLPLANGQGFRGVPRDFPGRRLNIEEYNLFGDSVMIFGSDDELASVGDLDPVDDEGVVVADVPLHVLDALLQLDVAVVPGDGARSQRDDSASEFRALALHGKGGLGLDDEAGSGALSVDENLLHAILFHLQLPQRAELAEATQREDKLVPVCILLPDLFANREEPVASDLQGLVGVITGQPGVLQTLVSVQTFLLLFDQQLPDEIFALLAHVGEGFLVELPVASLDVLQGLDVICSGKGGKAGQKDVSEDADGPHVGEESDWFAFDDFWSGEFCRSSRDLDQLVRVEFGGQAEVDDLDDGAL